MKQVIAIPRPQNGVGLVGTRDAKNLRRHGYNLPTKRRQLLVQPTNGLWRAVNLTCGHFGEDGPEYSMTKILNQTVRPHRELRVEAAAQD
ncbi:MAG: hypothetical protein HYU36_04215 [Planctomycetes bacterium]|nr:hypothetical protein [Planctomycetota bacterium]